MARLTAAKRRKLQPSQFALGKGHYPINDRRHAANALSRSKQYATPGQRKRIRAKVCKKYPSLPSCKRNRTRRRR